MWLGEQMAQQPGQEQAACGGVVSIGGGAPAVVTHGEERNLQVFSPGGYVWQPAQAETVAVLPGVGAVLGSVQEDSSLQPGEVKIFSRGAAIYLKNDGSIHLEGAVYINGERWVAHGGDSD